MYLALRISQSMRGKKHVNLGLWWNIVEDKLFPGQDIGDVPEKIMVYLGAEAWKEILFTACAKTEHWDNYSYTNSPNQIQLLDLYSSILSLVLWWELVQSLPEAHEKIFSSLSILKTVDPIKTQVILWAPMKTQLILYHRCTQNSSIASQFIQIKSQSHYSTLWGSRFVLFNILETFTCGYWALEMI